MPWFIAVALLVVPVIEIYVIIQVGQVIGGWQTVALLLFESALGAWLIKREGRRAWNALQEATQTARMPGKELADAALVLVGGTLLLTPGFITDIFGFFFVLPFTRPLARKVLSSFLSRRIAGQLGGNPITGFMPGTFRPPTADDAERAHRERAAADDVVQGEVIDPDRPTDK
ncbi:FxsA family protein [Streptomyces sp. SID13031]|uniref:FxsA family protein n=1 Tax=Streptomyces sp. SID13031 TaxID=2706046 RepID=UPI0013C6ACEA|nr:FxsA family protein [Streptomyces sp. SID13031]NEA32469.1 FxsA family protein [Streptomyces sp. SID13031]